MIDQNRFLCLSQLVLRHKKCRHCGISGNIVCCNDAQHIICHLDLVMNRMIAIVIVDGIRAIDG